MSESAALVEVVVVQVAGSAPTAIGDSLYLAASGWYGSVGGGALEESLKSRAIMCRERGDGAVVEFSLNSDHDQCCGGRVTALICLVSPTAARWVEGGAPRLYGWDHMGSPRLIGAWWQGRWQASSACDESDLATNEWPAGVCAWRGRMYFLKRAGSRPPLWLFGAGHVGAAIAEMACRLEYDVSVYDSRPEWNAASRFPPKVNRHIVAMPPAEEVVPAPSVLVMTHSHGLDFAITTMFLTRNVPYLGVIGSRTKAALFRKRLQDRGFSANDLARLHMPMGFAGLGKKPYEVAVAVLADLLQRRHEGAL